MNKPEPRLRIVLPSLVWLLMAVASFVAAVGVWQSQRLERLRPPAIVAPALAPGGTSATSAATGGATAGAAAGDIAGAATRPLATAPVGPALAAAEDPASAPLRQLDPQAGRLVLRCVTKGRVTYRDLNAGCPDGAAERVTVFPTEGVGKPQ